MKVQTTLTCKGKTNGKFLEEVYELVGNDYIFLDVYKNNATKLNVVHNVCGHVYKVTPNSFLSRKSRCPKCSKNRKLHSTFIDEVKREVGNTYEVTGTYVNSITKVEFKHVSCGHVYNVKPNDFLINKHRCPVCSKGKRTHESFVSKVYELVGDDYTVLGKYEYSREKLSMLHTYCGTEYKVSPDNFMRGKRCPKCYHSKGEDKVQRLLDKMKVSYCKEKTFDNLVGMKGGKLKFDFAILKDDCTVKGIIEYDGEGHYIEVSKFRNLETTQAHDKIKNTYCEDNNIPLLRIPYWEFDNIDKLVTEFLHKIKEEHNAI